MVTFYQGPPQIPPQPGKSPEPLPFSARDMRVMKILEDAQEILSTPEWKKFTTEKNAFYRYLKDKYGVAEAHRHTIFHALGASSFFPEDAVDIEEDFPGEDSVELFVDNLAIKYRVKK